MSRFLGEILGPAAEFVRGLGAMTLFFVQLLRYSVSTFFGRFNLVVGQVFNSGAMSIVIIMVCGLFIGGVLGLLTYDNLDRFNAKKCREFWLLSQ